MPFTKNDPNINREGRPKGSISVITRLKQIFQENPDDFENFIRKYKENPMNEKHIVEMIDGKPKGTMDLNADVTFSLSKLFDKTDKNEDE